MLGLELGASSLSQVLYALGSPAGIGLTGDDSEGRGKPTDDVVLRYERSFPPLRAERCEIVLTLAAASGKLRTVSIQLFPGDAGLRQGIPLHEVTALYGEPTASVELALVPVADGLEAELQECPGRHTDVRSLVFRKHGLQVLLSTDPGAGEPLVARLIFSADLLLGKDLFPTCHSAADAC